MVFVQTDELEAIEERLLNPHPYDPNFYGEGQTVFRRQGYYTDRGEDGKKVEVCTYASKIPNEGWLLPEKHAAARKAAQEKFSETCAAFFQEYLRVLLGNPELVLVYILSGVDQSNGYPYRVYGYIVKP